MKYEKMNRAMCIKTNANWIDKAISNLTKLKVKAEKTRKFVDTSLNVMIGALVTDYNKQTGKKLNTSKFIAKKNSILRSYDAGFYLDVKDRVTLFDLFYKDVTGLTAPEIIKSISGRVAQELDALMSLRYKLKD